MMFERKKFIERDNTGLTNFGVSQNRLRDIWDRDEEINRCYAEIERQRALIERAKPMAEHCYFYGKSEYIAELAKEWLRDVSGGEWV